MPNSAPSQKTRGSVLQLVGFGCLQTWINVVFMSDLIHYSASGSIAHLNWVYLYWCVGMVAMCALAAVPWRRLFAKAGAKLPDVPAFWARHGRVLLCLAACAVVVWGTWILIEAERHPPGRPWCIVASITTGMAASVLYWHWGAVFASSMDRTLAARFGGSFALAAVVYIAIVEMPETAGLVATMLLPVATTACLALWPHGDVKLQGALNKAPRHGRQVFARALAAVGLLGFSANFMRSLFQTDNAFDSLSGYGAMLLGSAVCAALVAIVTNRARGGRDSIGRVNHVMMLAMALLFLLTPAVWGLGLASDAMTTASFFLLHILVWVTLTQIVGIYRLEARTSFALGLGVAHLGCFVGFVAGTPLIPLAAADYRVQIAMAVGCACLVFASFLFIVNERTFVELLDIEQDAPAAPRRFALRCEKVAQMHGLTAKETEVMLLIAKGRSAQRIQEQLGVALGTVNTHVSRIYKKMDVHGRQELLDLIDGEGAE